MMQAGRMMRVLAALLAGAVAVAAQADEADLRDYLGGQGCLVNEATRAAAREAGFAGTSLDALAARADGSGLLPPELCTIRPPRITSRLTLDDPAVVAALTAPDAFAAHDIPGCFIMDLHEQLMRIYGLDEAEAYAEDTRFSAAGFLNGDLAFFHKDPSRHPPGIQIMAQDGDCGPARNLEVIRASQQVWIDNFDALVRAHASAVRCRLDLGGRGLRSDVLQDMLSGQLESDNALAWFEMMKVFQAAGWYVQTPEANHILPPLCHLD